MAKITLPPNGDPKQVSRMVELAKSLLIEHNLPDWKIKLDRSKSQAGYCEYKTRTISLSAVLFSVWSTEECRDTILHEIAHALTIHDPGHGLSWKAMAMRIGAQPERCFSVEQALTVSKYIGTCPEGHKSARNRLTQNARKGFCKKCYQRGRYNHFEWSES